MPVFSRFPGGGQVAIVLRVAGRTRPLDRWKVLFVLQFGGRMVNPSEPVQVRDKLRLGATRPTIKLYNLLCSPKNHITPPVDHLWDTIC